MLNFLEHFVQSKLKKILFYCSISVSRNVINATKIFFLHNIHLSTINIHKKKNVFSIRVLFIIQHNKYWNYEFFVSAIRHTIPSSFQQTVQRIFFNSWRIIDSWKSLYGCHVHQDVFNTAACHKGMNNNIG